MPLPWADSEYERWKRRMAGQAPPAGSPAAVAASVREQVQRPYDIARARAAELQKGWAPPLAGVEAIESLHTDNPDADAAKTLARNADTIMRILQARGVRTPAPDVLLALTMSGLGPRSIDELVKMDPMALAFPTKPEAEQAAATLRKITGTEPQIPEKKAAGPKSVAEILAGEESLAKFTAPFTGKPYPGVEVMTPGMTPEPTFARNIAEAQKLKKAEEKFGGKSADSSLLGPMFSDMAAGLDPRPEPIPGESFSDHAERQQRLAQIREFGRQQEIASRSGPQPGETFDVYVSRRTKELKSPEWRAPPVDWGQVRAYAEEKFRTEMPSAIGAPVLKQIADWRQDKDLYDKIENEKQQLYGIREQLKGIDPGALPADFNPAELDEAIAQYEFAQDRMLRDVQGPFGDAADPREVFNRALLKIAMRPPLTTLAFEQGLTNDAMYRKWTEITRMGEGGVYYGLAPVEGEIRTGVPWGPEPDQVLSSSDAARGLDPETQVYVYDPISGIQTGRWRLGDIVWSDTVSPGAFVHAKTVGQQRRANDFWKDKSPLPESVDQVRERFSHLKGWEIGMLQRFLVSRDYPVVITEKFDEPTLLAITTHYLHDAVLDLDNESEARRRRAEDYLTSWGQMLTGVRDPYGVQVKPGLYESVPGLFNLERRTGEPSLPENQPDIPAAERERRYLLRKDLLEHFSTGLPADLAAGDTTPLVALARELGDTTNPDRFREAFPITTSLLYDTGIGKAQRYEFYRRTAPAGFSEEQMVQDYRMRYGEDAMPENIKNKYLTGWEHILKDDFSRNLGDLMKNVGDVGGYVAEGGGIVADRLNQFKEWLDGKAEADPTSAFADNWEFVKMTADGLADMVGPVAAVELEGAAALGRGLGTAGTGVLEGIDAAGRGMMFGTLVAKTGISGLIDGDMSYLYDNFWRWRDASQNTGGENLLMKDMGVDPERHPLAAFGLDFLTESASLVGAGGVAKAGVKLAGLDRAFVDSLVGTGLADDTFKLISETEDIPTIVRLTGRAPGVEGEFLYRLQQAKSTEAARAAYDDWVGGLNINPNAGLVRDPFELTPGNAMRQAVTRIAEAGRMDFVPRWFRPWLTASDETVNGLDISRIGIYETIEKNGQTFGLKKSEIDDWMNRGFEMQMENFVGAEAGGAVRRATGMAAERRFRDEFSRRLFEKTIDDIAPGTTPEEFLKMFPLSMHEEIARSNRSLVERAVLASAEGGNQTAQRLAGKLGYKSKKQSAYGEELLFGAAAPEDIKKVAAEAEQAAAEVPDMFQTVFSFAKQRGYLKPPKRNLKEAEDFAGTIADTERLHNFIGEYKRLLVDDIMDVGAKTADDIEKELAKRLKGDDNFKALETAYDARVADLMARPQYRDAKDIRKLFSGIIPDDGLDYLIGLVKKMRRAETTLVDTRPRPLVPSALSYNYRSEIPMTYLASLRQLRHMLPGPLTREQVQNFLHLDHLHKLWKSSILFGWGTQAKIAFDDISRLLVLGINPLWGRKDNHRFKWLNVPDDVAEGDLRRLTAALAAPQDYRYFGPGHETLTKKAYEQWLGTQVAHDPFAHAWVKADDAALTQGLSGAEREAYVKNAFTAYARKNYKTVAAEGYRALPYADEPRTVTSLYRNVPKTEGQTAAEVRLLDNFYRREARLGEEDVKKMFLRAADKSTKKKPFRMNDAEWQMIEGMQPTVWAAEDAAERFYRDGLLGAMARAGRATVDVVYKPLSTASSWSRGAVYRRYFDATFDDLVNVAKPTAETYINANYLADAYARKMVDAITYNFARTPLEHALRNIVPFGPAYRDFYVFWAQHFARHPTHAAVTARMQNIPDDAQTRLGRGVVEWLPYVGDELATLAEIALGVGAAGPLTVFRYNPRSAFFLTGGISSFLPSVGPILTIPLSKLIESDPEGYAWIQSLPGFAFANPDSAMFSKLDKLLYAATGAMSLAPGLKEVVRRPLSMGHPFGIPLGFSDDYIKRRESAEYAWLLSEWIKNTGLSYSWMAKAGQLSVPLPDLKVRNDLRKQAHENVIRQQGLLFAGQFMSPAGFSMETPAYQLERARSLILRAETKKDRMAAAAFLSGRGTALPEYLVGKGQSPLPLAPELRHYPEKMATYYSLSPRGRKRFLFENPTVLPLVAPRTVKGTTLIPVEDVGAGEGKKPIRERASLDEFDETVIANMIDSQRTYTTALLQTMAKEAKEKIWADIEASQGRELSQAQKSKKNWELLGLREDPEKVKAEEKRMYAEYLLTSAQGPYATRYADVFPLVAAKAEADRLGQWDRIKGKGDLTDVSPEQAAALGLPHDAATMAVLHDYYVAKGDIKNRMEAGEVTSFTSAAGRVFAAELDSKIAELSGKSPSFAEIYRLSKLPEWTRVRDLGLVSANPATRDEWAKAFGILDDMTRKMAELKATKDKNAVYEAALAEIEKLKGNEAFARELKNLLGGKSDLKPTTSQLRAYKGDYATVAPKQGGGRGRGIRKGRRGIRKGRRGRRGGGGVGAVSTSRSKRRKRRI